MRAVVLRETGGPEVLRLEEVPDPTPGEGEVLVRVTAAGVNHYDLNQRAGAATTFPTILGADGAGIRDDTYATRLTRSSSVSFATIGFIRSAHSPRRAPVCMSNICRAR